MIIYTMTHTIFVDLERDLNHLFERKIGPVEEETLVEAIAKDRRNCDFYIH